MAVKSLESFDEDNRFFKSLLDMIPATVIFDTDARKKIRGEDEQETDEETQSKSKRKDKKLKPDPLKRKTVSQLQEDLDQQAGQSFTQLKNQRKKGKKQSNNDQKLKSITHNMEEMRAKLQARIKELAGSKKTLTEEETKEKSRLIKKNKKLRLKLKRAQKQNKHKGMPGSASSNTDDSPSQSEPYSVSQKPVYNKEGKLVFSKFDFTDTADSEKPKTDLKGKNYKRLLEKLEKRKKRVNEVRSKSEEAAQKIEEKTTWKNTLLKAEGEKIKDSEVLLKKALKRKEKQKDKRGKSWDSRVKHVQHEKKKRQDKRKQNLDKRKQQKMDKKKKKLVKKGRLIPGF